MPAHAWGDGVSQGQDIGSNYKVVRDQKIAAKRKAKRLAKSQKGLMQYEREGRKLLGWF